MGRYVIGGTGQIWMVHVNGTGCGQNLISYSHIGWGSHHCSHLEDAGEECSGKGKIKI
jgi:hypothetical protein